MLALIYDIFLAVKVFILHLLRYTVLRTPISYPGDAIANPLMRRGKWHDKAAEDQQDCWKFSCDLASHDISQRWAPFPVTGEGAGRQIWYQDSKHNDATVKEAGTFT